MILVGQTGHEYGVKMSGHSSSIYVLRGIDWVANQLMPCSATLTCNIRSYPTFVVLWVRILESPLSGPSAHTSCTDTGGMLGRCRPTRREEDRIPWPTGGDSIGVWALNDDYRPDGRFADLHYFPPLAYSAEPRPLPPPLPRGTSPSMLNRTLVPGQDFELESFLPNATLMSPPDRQTYLAASAVADFLLFSMGTPDKYCRSCLTHERVTGDDPVCYLLTAGNAYACLTCVFSGVSCTYPRTPARFRQEMRDEREAMKKLYAHWGFDRWHSLRCNRPTELLSALEQQLAHQRRHE